MSDTPRTDAEANGGNSMGVLMGNGLRYALVQSEFARQLERELNAANARIKRLEDVLEKAELAVAFANREHGVIRMMADDYTEVLQQIRVALKAKEAKP